MWLIMHKEANQITRTFEAQLTKHIYIDGY